MPYLTQSNKRANDEDVEGDPIVASGQHVVVIGGGDTASDCVGTAFRQGALSVTQLDIRPRPPEREDKLTVWPYWPTKMRTSSSQAEGAEREFQAATLSIEGRNGRVTGVGAPASTRSASRSPEPSSCSRPTSSSSRSASPDRSGPGLPRGGGGRASTGAATSPRTTATTARRATKVFVAGDMRRGQSLIVWAIREGRQAARSIDEHLTGQSVLPR